MIGQHVPAFDRVREALGERYRVDSELGSGASATVFRALDRKMGREVAVKVLYPELAATLQRDRFIREIEFAARLSHPNILPVFDAGVADGLLYYTMPLVEGDTLSARIELGGGQLPVSEAVRVATQIATALGYAHAQGLVHRDVKPENILMPSGEVVVADFGIATALGESGGERLTRSGISVGTPLYMSPEQASAQERIDGRSDLYALGCVLFEMLCGAPPFHGPSAAAVLARHRIDPPPPIRTVRPTVAPGLEKIVTKLLAKAPADRFQTAEEVVQALSTGQFDAIEPSYLPRMRRKGWLVAAFATASVMVAALVSWPGLAPAFSGSEGVVAVMPFHQTGTVDTALTRDVSFLMRAALNGEGGPRAADERTVEAVLANGWPFARRTDPPTDSRAIRASRRAGAGLLLAGTIFANGDRVVLSARVIDGKSEQVRAAVEDIDGDRREMKEVVDRAVAGLLVQMSNEPRRRFAQLLEVPLPALRDYLEGRRLYGEGRYRDAILQQEEALRIDSTFIQASLALSAAGRRLKDVSVAAGGLQGALTAGSATDLVDSLQLRALAGPVPGRPFAIKEQLEAWDMAARADPGNPDPWVELGWLSLEWGAIVDPSGAVDHQNAFERALAADSNHVPALEGLINGKLAFADTVGLRALAGRYGRASPAGDMRSLFLWRVDQALASHDLGTRLSEAVDTNDVVQLQLLIGYVQLDGVSQATAYAALDLLERRSANPLEVRRVGNVGTALELNGGRPRAYARFRRELVGGSPTDLIVGVLNAIYWGADTVGISVAIDGAEREVRGTKGELPLNVAALNCPIGLWRVKQGRVADARRASAVLDRFESAINVATTYIPLCARMIRAEADAAEPSGSAAASLSVLEGLANDCYPTFGWVSAAASLLAARLHEKAGAPDLALSALERRAREPTGWGTTFLSTFLREEGRLAAELGRTAQAARAYRHYLALRANPEEGATLRESERIRVELDDLLRRTKIQ